MLDTSALPFLSTHLTTAVGVKWDRPRKQAARALLLVRRGLLRDHPARHEVVDLRLEEAGEAERLAGVLARLRGAALRPARWPNTRASVMALPESRLAPLAPPTASPAAKSPALPCAFRRPG